MSATAWCVERSTPTATLSTLVRGRPWHPIRIARAELGLGIRITLPPVSTINHAKKHAPVARSGPFKSLVHRASGPQKTERGENHDLRARGCFDGARDQGGPPGAWVVAGRTGLSVARSG